tara:strand:- start:549 stop:968 length:420 start_codon:yes stop_codon:yes gene_type:complete
MITWYVIAAIASLSLLGVDQAYAQQVIEVGETTPCFLDYNATGNMWENCGAQDDFLSFALLPWEWITGGFFSMIIVSLFIIISYVKYHNVMYPILIGVMFLPISYFVFPESFISWALILAGVGLALTVAYIFIKQTKEY